MSKKNVARYEPGELDKVRKNLGELDPAESQRMANLLGGEVGVEKSIQPSPEAIRAASAKKRQYIPTKPMSEEEIQKQQKQQENLEQMSALQKRSIPYLSPAERKAFYKLLTSSNYKISQKPGFFKLLMSFGKPSPDDLSLSFVKTKIPQHVKHIDSFIDAMKNLMDSTTGEYKQKITTDDDPYFKTLRYIYDWNTIMLTETSRTLASTQDPIMEDAIPVTKELFKHLMRFYFLGESKMAETIKKLYVAATKPNATNKAKNLAYAKQATAEWIYVFSKIIHGTYPLLMRLTSTQCYPFPDFYSQNISKILPFLGITKFDLILPKKETAKEATPPPQPANAPVKPEEESEKFTIPKEVEQSLNVLNNLFPNAGWKDLEKKPDMYTYFQPLYQFRDGFNVLSPSNPLQITIVLLRIIEDFFQGCRNIIFNIDSENPEHADYVIVDDSLQKIIAEWSQYREVIFNKTLCPELRDYVNRVYAQNDFKKSKYAKKQLSAWLWQMKYLFHPHLSFEIVFLERPAHDLTYKSLPVRVHQITSIFSSLIKGLGEGQEATANFKSPYRFDVENPIAFRLNVLLGEDKSELKTNLNLMKYTLHALKVLDWWINDKGSLAYKEEIVVPYRTEEENGEPSFSAPLRKNQKELFLHYAKKRHAEEHKEASPPTPPDTEEANK